MELFVIIYNSWKPLTIITKCSILDIAVVLNPSRNRLLCILKNYMAAYLCSVILLLLILVPFTAILDVLMQCLRLCFFELEFLFPYSTSSKWSAHTFIYRFIIEIRTFFVTSDVASISALEKMLLKNAF